MLSFNHGSDIYFSTLAWKDFGIKQQVKLSKQAGYDTQTADSISTLQYYMVNGCALAFFILNKITPI